MRAIVVDTARPSRFIVREVSDPIPAPDETIIRVLSVSINPGEVRHASTQASDGWRPGWDFMGVVEQAARDGAGPIEGRRVVGFVENGSWAERIAVKPSALAELPETVSNEVAACLPVAGLTALWTLDEGGLLAGRKVLINGASGGVGHMALQIAAASAADVVAAIRTERHRSFAEQDGAGTVLLTGDLASAAVDGPYDLILDSTGGPALAHALGMLTRQGVCVSFGNSSATETTFEPFDFLREGTRLVGFYLLPRLQEGPAKHGLERLVRLVVKGVLRPRITARVSWNAVEDVSRRMMNREIVGKAVMIID